MGVHSLHPSVAASMALTWVFHHTINSVCYSAWSKIRIFAKFLAMHRKLSPILEKTLPCRQKWSLTGVNSKSWRPNSFGLLDWPHRINNNRLTLIVSLGQENILTLSHYVFMREDSLEYTQGFLRMNLFWRFCIFNSTRFVETSVPILMVILINY